MMNRASMSSGIGAYGPLYMQAGGGAERAFQNFQNLTPEQRANIIKQLLPDYASYGDDGLIDIATGTGNRDFIRVMRDAGLINQKDFEWYDSYFKNDADWLSVLFNDPDRNIDRENVRAQNPNMTDDNLQRLMRLYDAIDKASSAGGFRVRSGSTYMPGADVGAPGPGLGISFGGTGRNRPTFIGQQPTGYMINPETGQPDPFRPYYTTTDVLVDSTEQPYLYTYNVDPATGRGQFDPYDVDPLSNPYDTAATTTSTTYVPPDGRDPGDEVDLGGTGIADIGGSTDGGSTEGPIVDGGVPAQGTVLSSECRGTTLVESIADGKGGARQKITARSESCGYKGDTSPGGDYTPGFGDSGQLSAEDRVLAFFDGDQNELLKKHANTAYMLKKLGEGDTKYQDWYEKNWLTGKNIFSGDAGIYSLQADDPGTALNEAAIGTQSWHQMTEAERLAHSIARGTDYQTTSGASEEQLAAARAELEEDPYVFTTFDSTGGAADPLQAATPEQAQADASQVTSNLEQEEVVTTAAATTLDPGHYIINGVEYDEQGNVYNYSPGFAEGVTPTDTTGTSSVVDSAQVYRTLNEGVPPDATPIVDTTQVSADVLPTNYSGFFGNIANDVNAQIAAQNAAAAITGATTPSTTTTPPTTTTSPTPPALMDMANRRTRGRGRVMFAQGGIVGLTGGMNLQANNGQGLESFLQRRSKAALRRNLAKVAPRPTMQTGIMPMAR